MSGRDLSHAANEEAGQADGGRVQAGEGRRMEAGRECTQQGQNTEQELVRTALGSSWVSVSF